MYAEPLWTYTLALGAAGPLWAFFGPQERLTSSWAVEIWRWWCAACVYQGGVLSVLWVLPSHLFGTPYTSKILHCLLWALSNCLLCVGASARVTQQQQEEEKVGRFKGPKVKEILLAVVLLLLLYHTLSFFFSTVRCGLLSAQKKGSAVGRPSCFLWSLSLFVLKSHIYFVVFLL